MIPRVPRNTALIPPDVEFHNHYSITNIARLFKLLCLRWKEHVANMRGMCMYIADVNLCKRAYLTGLTHIEENNIKKNLKVIACGLFNELSCPHTYGFIFTWPALESDCDSFAFNFRS
jgi:hypothetical protein